MTKFDPLNPEVKHYKHNNKTSVFMRQIPAFKNYAVYIEDSGNNRPGYFASCSKRPEAQVIFDAWTQRVKSEDMLD